jgi:hypothetical protein
MPQLAEHLYRACQLLPVGVSIVLVYGRQIARVQELERKYQRRGVSQLVRVHKLGSPGNGAVEHLFAELEVIEVRPFLLLR